MNERQSDSKLNDRASLEKNVIGKRVIDCWGSPCGTASHVYDGIGGKYLVEIERRSLLGLLQHRVVPKECILEVTDPELKLSVSRRELKRETWRKRGSNSAIYPHEREWDDRRHDLYFIL